MEEYKEMNKEEKNIWCEKYINKMKEYNKKEINMKILSRNKNINEEIVKNHKELKWNIVNLCENPSISYKLIDEMIKKERIEYTENELYLYKKKRYKNGNYIIGEEKIDDLDISNLSLNKNIKWEDIENNKDIKWDYGYLSRNTNIKIENILENMGRGWDFGEIMRNPILEISKIDNKTLLRQKKEYFENPNFELKSYMEKEEIKSYLDINRSIHRNKNISIKILNEIVEKYPEFEIDYELLGDKRKIEINYILSKNENWNMYYISQNPNLRFEFIERNKYEWDKEGILLNTFDKERKEFVKDRF
jgi:hypothetical protein